MLPAREPGRIFRRRMALWAPIKTVNTPRPGEPSRRDDLHARLQPGIFGAQLSQRKDNMAWLNLVIAGLLEIGWAVGLKYTESFTRLWPSLLTIAVMIASFYFLGQALRIIPVGTGYAVWTGIGAVGTAILGIMLFAESAAPARLLCILLIIIGIIGLKFTSPE